MGTDTDGMAAPVGRTGVGPRLVPGEGGQQPITPPQVAQPHRAYGWARQMGASSHTHNGTMTPGTGRQES